MSRAPKTVGDTVELIHVKESHELSPGTFMPGHEFHSSHDISKPQKTAAEEVMKTDT